MPLDAGSSGEQYAKTGGRGWGRQVKAFTHPSSPQDTPQNCERYLNWAHAFLVVYSVDSRHSFEGGSNYLDLLALHARETQRSRPALLLGNKLDMAQYR